MFSTLIYYLEKMGLTKTKAVNAVKTDKAVKAVDKKKLTEDRKAVEKALDNLSISDKNKKGGAKTDKTNKTDKTEKTVVKTTSVKKTTLTKVKKSFNLLGQKKTTPPETDSLRKFYTSLLVQNPESKMAMEWCLERGLIPEKNIKKIMKKLGKTFE